MTAKNRVLRLFKVLTLCLLLAPMCVWAQNNDNLIPSIISDFTIHYVGNGHTSNNLSNVGVDTDYDYVYWENGLLGDDNVQHYAIGTNAQFYSYNSPIWGIELGMFDFPDHTTGDGNYMIVNGATSSGKRVWEYTVNNIIPGAEYQFEVYVTALYMYPYGTAPQEQRPKLRLKINDHDVGPIYHVQWHNNSGHWDQWTQNWTADDTSARITIIDEITIGNGNDFGLDDIVFKLSDSYSLTANSFTAQYCGDLTPLDLTGQYVISGGNPALPVQVMIKQNNSAQWGTECNTYYGSAHATVGSDNRIYFTLNNPNFHGTDYIRYQVSCMGLQDDGLITIKRFEAPSNCSPQDLPSSLCMDDVPSFNPTANWTDNGSSIFSSYWEFKKDGATGWLSSGNFQSYVQSNGGIGAYSIRFYAENECGPTTSDEFPLNVIDKPTIGSIDNIVPTSVCAPTTLSLDSPSVVDNGSDIIAEGWRMPVGGQWVVPPNSIEYQPGGSNVYNICYYAENGCGATYSTPVSLVVNAAPVVGPINPPEGICAGESFDFSLVTPSPEWRHNDLSTCWGSWEIQIDGEWDSLVNNNIPFDYNGYLIRYKAVNGCDTTYSTNNVPVTVYSTDPVYEGAITACDTIYHHGIQCYQTSMYTWDSISDNGCHIQVSWHFALDTVNLMSPIVVEACNYYFWPRTQDYYDNTGVYYDTVPGVGNVCDSIFTLDLTINRAPTMQGNIQVNDICAGDLLTVVEPEYAYNHSEGGHIQWEYAVLPDDTFHGFAPETHHFVYGSYNIRFAVYNNCDSIFSDTVLVHVNDRPVITGQLESLQVCAGNPLDLPEVDVDWRNASQDGDSEWQLAEGQDGQYHYFDPGLPMQMNQNGYWVRFMAGNECDTVYLGPVHVTVIDVQDVTVEHGPECDTVWYAGVYYTESTTVDEQVDEPCPYTIHHEIIVNHSDLPENNPDLIEVVSSCHDEFEWHGKLYYRTDGPQTDRWITENISGCDSIMELRLSFGDADEFWDIGQHGCDTYTWQINDTLYRDYLYDEGHPYVMDTVFIPGEGDNCDTYYYLELTMDKNWEDWESPCETIPLCRGDEYNGVYYYNDVFVSETLQATTGCDSIVSRYLSIIQPVDTVVELVSCKAYDWHGHHFEMDTIVTDTLQSFVTGCDSIVTMHFKLDDITTIIDTVACESFEWYGYHCYYDPNHPEGMTIQHVFELESGCDSIVTKHVLVNHTIGGTKIHTECVGYVFPFNGVLYDEPGVFFIDTGVVISQYGCDSIIYRVQLEILDVEQIGQISGNSYVYVASSLTSGIYRYEIDTSSIDGGISWSISNPQWRVLDQDAVSCRVLVLTPGSAELVAHFKAPCGEFERSFNINATFYGVDDHDVIDAKVYPNPTQGTVTIEAEGIESIRLTNMLGQVLDWREYDRSEAVTMDLNGFAPSVYLLEIKTVEGMVKKRLVVSR